MSDPSKRFITVVLSLGILVLIAGIALGEREGNRVIGQVTETRMQSIAPVTVTPAPVQTDASAYGPDWKRTDVMSAATDPGFADPRVPPVQPPTPTPVPSRKPATPSPTPSPTPNLNLPIWRRTAPLPTASPTGSGSPSVQPSASVEPTDSPQP